MAMADMEKADDGIFNHSVNNFGWQNINVSVKDRLDTKSQRVILKDIGGVVNAGEMMAIMGPSGSGKTTLLNVLAGRQQAGAESATYIDSAPADGSTVRRVSAYVEQDDALCGGLTARETLHFAARLSRRQDCKEQVENLLRKLGLQSQADTLIGTPIRKGMSGGQKRRVSIAEQLITNPSVLFLDEPTSGLDSTSSWKVVKHLSDLAKSSGFIIIMAIHQPSSSVFRMFDKVLLLGKGETKYNKAMSGVREYLNACGVQSDISEPEGLLNIANQDFPSENPDSTESLVGEALGVDNTIIDKELLTKVSGKFILDPPSDKRDGLTTVQRLSDRFLGSIRDDRPSALAVVRTLVHRSLIKSYRDILPYGIRIGMYMGLAIMMGTIWLRLATDQDNIQSFINAIFFGGAFMSFMAVAYIPAFLEDRALFAKERAHGLYGPTSFLVANFITGIPYLFVFALFFSVIVYWLCNFRPTAEAFFTWIMWLFLDLLAAESLVVFVSSVYPVFVVALAGTAFANGLWMCAGGFLVPPQTLNVFWRYLFHYIDYQSYVFQGMMVNEFSKRNFACARTEDNACSCMYKTSLSEQCLVAGTGVLEKYGYQTGDSGKWVGIMVVIIFGYRILAWVALKVRMR